VLDVSEMPDYDEDAGGLIGAEDDGDDGNEIEVEVNEAEPLFLKGQTRATVNLSPVKIVKNPDGSLQVTRRPALPFLFPTAFAFSFFQFDDARQSAASCRYATRAYERTPRAS
jgi:hypothetical protein